MEMVIYILIGIGIVVLIIGILGFYQYHYKNWPDAIYNATAIMSGVGAADTPHATSAQIFASFYTMVVGLLYLIFLTVFISIALNNTNFFFTQ